MNKQWDYLQKSFEEQRLAHSYLLSGQDVKEIESFAKEFTKFINCISPNFNGHENFNKKSGCCNKCQNCRMIEGDSFPDLMVMRSKNSKSSKDNEKDMMEISIEQVRYAQNFLALKAYYGNFKSIIIENADRMTSEAQNCFLKTLEEPKGKTIIFLVTSKPDSLLQTIFSRCQQVKFYMGSKSEISPDEQKVMSDLQRILGADLAEKFSFAKNTNLEGENFANIINILQKFFRKELISKIMMQSSGTKYSVFKVRNILNTLQKISHKASTSNINQKMALEIILLDL